MDIHAERILILDFGSQYTQLIARRVRELNVYCEIHRPDLPAEKIRAFAPRGIVLSGSPSSVEQVGAPFPDPAVFDQGVPVIDLRLVCNDRSDYGNPIEPSARGGLKIAGVIARVVREHDFARVATTVYTQV
jgi:hypothetical protein